MKTRFRQRFNSKITKAGAAYAHPFPLSCVQSDRMRNRTGATLGTLEAYWKANADLAFVTLSWICTTSTGLSVRTYRSLPPAGARQTRSGSHGVAAELAGFRRLAYYFQVRWWCSRCCSLTYV